MYISAVRIYNSRHDVGGSFSDIARYISSLRGTEGFKCCASRRDRRSGRSIRPCYLIVLPCVIERNGSAVNSSVVIVVGTGELAHIVATELRARFSEDRFLVAYGVLV